MELYSHQQEMVDGILGEIAFGSTNVIGEAATSFGKTLVISQLCKELKGRIVVLVNITPLIDQISEHLTEMNVDHSILKAGMEDKFEENHHVQLVMSQTYYARKDKLEMTADYIIQDERHREYDTDRTNEVVRKLKPKAIIGLTATPWDQSGFAFDGADIVRSITVQELQDKGFLCPIRYYVPKWSEKINYSNVSKSGNDYNTVELDDIINTESHLKLAIQSMNELNAKDLKTIVFCSSIDQCDLFTKMLKEDGYEAEAYHSKVNKKDADRIMHAFKANTSYSGAKEELDQVNLFSEDKSPSRGVKLICSVSRLSIGFSVKDIQLGVMLRPTKVRSLYYQQVGRLCRTHPDKEYAIFLDLGQTLSRFGMHTANYLPPKRTNNSVEDKNAMAEVEEKLSLEHLGELLSDKKLEEVHLDTYNLKVQEIKSKANNIKSATIPELAALFNMTMDIKKIIEIGAEIWTRKYGRPISKAGRAYDFNVDWLSEEAIKGIEEYPDYKRQFTNAYRTRARNIIKQGKNYNAIKFFIEFLIEENIESVIPEPVYVKNDLDIDLEEIPF